jgi:hypothetical protein
MANSGRAPRRFAFLTADQETAFSVTTEIGRRKPRLDDADDAT